nr:cell wall protein DAN4-like [Crassostrea gigas]
MNKNLYKCFCQIERIKPHYMPIMKRCGKFKPFYIELDGNIFVVTFVSDNIQNARGSNLSWKVYIPDTTITKPTTTTTKITTTRTKPPPTTTEITTFKTTEEPTTTTTTETTKKTTSRTTKPNPTAKKSTREIHTLPLALLTSNQKQPKSHKFGPFTKNTESYIAKEKANNQTATFNLREITYLISAIVVIEVILTAIGIQFVKQRWMNFRNHGHEEVNKSTTNPYSILSRDSGNRNYEVTK